MEYVKWLKDIRKEDLPFVGGKNANLGEMIHAGIPVPPGFAVTTYAFEEFMNIHKLKDKVYKMLSDLDVKDTEKLNKICNEIREMIESKEMPMEIEDWIGEYYRILSRDCRIPALPVAVRSSATAEDLPDASFAGQQDTFLWVRGIDNVLTYVKKCWSSLFNPRAVAYRIGKGFDHTKVSLSVVVQKMVNSWAAGVMFTLDPVTGDLSKISIDAAYGFGEGIVSGECTPDHYVVDKVTFEIVEKKISPKEFYYVLDPETQKVIKKENPRERQNQQCLIDEDIVNLAKIGKKVEDYYGRPMDIEWAIDKDLPIAGNILILQARPETVWSEKKKKEKVLGKKSGLDLLINRAMNPFKLK